MLHLWHLYSFQVNQLAVFSYSFVFPFTARRHVSTLSPSWDVTFSFAYRTMVSRMFQEHWLFFLDIFTFQSSYRISAFVLEVSQIVLPRSIVLLSAIMSFHLITRLKSKNGHGGIEQADLHVSIHFRIIQKFMSIVQFYYDVLKLKYWHDTKFVYTLKTRQLLMRSLD